jgi:LmbE family N-acetylglucosaminyl deacetylase
MAAVAHHIRTMLTVLAIAAATTSPAAAQSTPSGLRGDSRSQSLVEAFGDGQTLLVFAHQDDDLLWMLPFWPGAKAFVLAAYPPSPVFERLVQNLPREVNYAARWRPAWETVSDDTFAEVFTDRCKRVSVVTLEAITAHLRPLLTSGVRRIVTHNNWGEYGHVQHRLVNVAARRLAAEFGLDVYALGLRVESRASDPSGYVDVAKGTGLPVIEGHFDPALFRSLRQIYLESVPAASTAELTATFRRWSPTLWTWSAAENAFPQGWQPFIQLVDHGVDLTVGNAAIERLETDVPLSGDCTTSPVLPAAGGAPRR